MALQAMSRAPGVIVRAFGLGPRARCRQCECSPPPAAAHFRGLCSGAECGVVAPASISPDVAFATSARPHSHRSHLHHVKQRSLFRSRGAFSVRGFLASSFASLPLRVLRPEEGAAERRRRVTGMSVALARRDALPPVRREGASRRSRWRFSAAGPTLHLPAVPTGIRAATSPTARRSRPADQVPRLPQPRFAPPPRDATPPLRPRGISGDAPRERGWDNHYYILSS
jgi:hypothetical protein